MIRNINKRNALIVIGINFLLLLIYYIAHTHIQHLRFATFSLTILILPFILGGSLYLLKKIYSWKLTFYSALVITLPLSLFILYAYKSSDVTDLYFDENNIHPQQWTAEEKVRKFILNNAAFPNSYHSIKFGNLSKDQIYKADKSYDLNILKNELDRDPRSTLDEILNTNTKQKLDDISYSITHTYELADNSGVKHRCQSHITFDSVMTVVFLVNNEDFLVKLWNEKNYKSTSWEKQYGKQTSR
ncbi:hypothetical protein [Pedobacter puniceum]|uniref:Uncharacterized protein n=1 Tax=Pedobacter puniceum TaxID=2666136 RepID=A0A7K0FLN1_9SPHI|nr:hypothetical protein [Pedobacter puniceum]MRX46305.1 hypothetical protein [Pedobacter puniceum]